MLCYHSFCVLEIFRNISAFVYVKANSMEIREERCNVFFFRKNVEVSIFWHVEVKLSLENAWLPIAPVKICFSRIVKNRAKYLGIRKHRP